MRHAKSSWAESGTPDVKRRLNKRGLRDTPRMAQFLEQQKIRIDHIACSHAVRARSTAELLIDSSSEINLDQLEIRQDFYLAPPHVYLEYLRQVENDQIQTLMVVGHNPGLETLVDGLSHSWETMPTAAIACFSIECDRWRDFSPAATTLIDVWRPKEVIPQM